MYARILLLLWITISSTITLLAQSNQDIYFENLNRQQGLSSNSLNQIIQDDKGFLWCATFNGLNRFDGVNFQHIKSNIPNDIIGGNHIRAIYWDKKGNLWIGTLKDGLSRYNPKTGVYTNFQADKNKEGTLSSNQILCFLEDSKGRLWVGTEAGLNLFDSETETFFNFLPSKDANSISALSVIGLEEDHRGWIWAATWAGGVNLVIPTDKKGVFNFRYFKNEENNPASLQVNNAWSLLKDNKNRLWVGTFNGGISLMLPSEETDPYKFQPKFITYRHSSLKLHPNEPTDNIVYDLTQDQNGRIWLATVDGISIFEPDRHFTDWDKIDPYQPSTIPTITFQHLQHNINLGNSIPHNEVKNIFFDKDGIAWCSTINGISKYDPNKNRFEHSLKPVPEIGNIFTSCMLEYDSSTLYIGTRSQLGLLKYNTTNNTYKSYTTQATTNALKSRDEILALYKIDQDTIIVGKRSSIALFFPKEERFWEYTLMDDKKEITDDLNPKEIIKDSKGRYWIASQLGLIEFDIQKGILNIIRSNDQIQFKKEIPNINSVIEDDKGYLWLSTYEGLYRLKVSEDNKMEMKTFLYDANDSTSICNDRVVVSTKYKRDLWFGSEDGLFSYNLDTERFYNITSADGLKNSSIFSIEISSDDVLWASTREGLFTYDLNTKKIRHFDKDDGLQSNTFNFLSSCRTADGKLYFGGINGLNGFYSEQIPLATTPPPVYLTGVKVFNKPKSFQTDYTNLKEIELDYEENYFTLEFSALSFTQAKENEYAYKLEGFDKNWIYSGHRNFASYTNLDPGTYTFRVKAANHDGFWNEEGITLTICIIPPFWATWWFRILAVLVVIGSVLFYFINRERVTKAQRIALENEVAIRTKEIEHQKGEIEKLVDELQLQNELLEIKVADRTQYLERINKDLLRSNKDLEQFAYIASHDLQEPLRMVGNFVQLLKYRYNKKIDEAGQDYIKFAVEGVKRMSNLIRSLLSYSKVGRSDTTFHIANLNHVINDKLADLSLLIQEKNAIIDVKELPHQVLCEEEQLGLVFYNLVSNALKFNTKEQPIVTIALTKENRKHYTFKVQDNGIGIEKAYHDKVFKIFKRLNNREDFEGNGIGLAICKRIINRHDGEIWFESEKGKGTTFYFTISKTPIESVIWHQENLN